MIEVPSLLFQLDELFRVVDFASVGSNDLMQFVMASDRANSRLAGRFDPLNPAFLRALRRIARAADAAGKPLTLCGEIAGRPLDALGARRDRLPLAVHGLGGDRAGQGGDPRARPAGRSASALNALIDQGASASEIRGELRAWAETHSVPI